MSFDEMTKKAIADVAVERAFAFAVTRLFTSGKLPLEALNELLAVSKDICWHLKFDDVSEEGIDDWIVNYYSSGRHKNTHAKLMQRI